MPATESLYVKSRRIWKTYSSITEQPQGGLSSRARIVSIIMYLVMLSIGIFFCITILTYNAQYTDVRFVSEAVLFRIPDVIICPRPKWAVETLVKRTAFKMPQNHQNYQYTVWYNYRLLDQLNMSQNDVDQFTTLVRDSYSNLGLIIPQQYQKFASMLLDLLTNSGLDTDNIATLYEERNKQLSLAESLNQSIPNTESLRRDKFIFMPSLKRLWLSISRGQHTVQHLWWAIISARYLSANEGVMADDPEYTHRMKCFNRPPNCSFNAQAVWVADDHYCWMWDNRDLLTHSDALKIYFYVSGLDANSDYQALVIDTNFEQVRMDNFMTPRLASDGFSERGGQTALLLGITPYNISGQPRQTVSQPLLSRSSLYQSFVPRVLDTYWRVSMYEDSTLSRQAVKMQVLGGIKESLSTQSTYTRIQILEQIGGVLGLFIGMSIFNLLNLLLTMCKGFLKMSRTLYTMLVVLLFVCFIILAVILVYHDVKAYNDKAIKNTLLVQLPSSVATPKSQFCPGKGNLHLLNVSKLTHHKVSLPLLNYLSIAGGYGPYTGILEELQLNDDAFDSNPSYWKEVYALVDKSTLDKREQLHEEYVQLAKQLEYDPVKPAYGLLRQFFLDPCAVIKWCLINGRKLNNCCESATYTRNTKYPNAKHCLTINVPLGMKLNGPMHSGIDITAVLQASDYKQHYWGVDPSLIRLAEQGLAVRMIQSNTLFLRFAFGPFSNPISGIGVMIFGQLNDQNFVNGRGIVISGDVTRSTLLSDLETDSSECRDEAVCSDYLHHNLMMQQLYVASKCGCVIQYDDSTTPVIPSDSKLSWCTPEQAVNCLTREELYNGYCNDKTTVARVNNGTLNLGRHIEAQFNPMFINFDTRGCNYEQVMIDGSKSPLKGTIERSVYDSNLHDCLRPVCETYAYKASAQKFISSHEYGSDVFLVTFQVDTPVVGTEQVNSYNGMELASLIFNIFGFLFGVSIFGFIDLLVTWFGKLVTTSSSVEDESRSAIDVVESHWNRSLGWATSTKQNNHVASLGTEMASANGHEADLKDVAFYDEEDTKRSSVKDAFYLVCLVILTTVGIILVFMLISNANLSAEEVRYSVGDGQYSPPAIAVCSKKVVSPQVLHNSLMNSTCSINNNSVDCQSAFSMYVQTTQHVACLVMDNSQRDVLTARGPGPIDVAVHFPQSIPFSIFWVGDLRMLPLKLPTLSADNWLNDEHVDVVYRVTQQQQYSKCSFTEDQLVPCASCASTNPLLLSTQPLQCCVRQLSRTLPMTTKDEQITPCNYTMYLAMAVYKKPLLNGGQKLTVRVMDYLVRQLIRNPRHTWASVISMIGGYLDPFLGVSVLNACFTLVIIMAWVKD